VRKGNGEYTRREFLKRNIYKNPKNADEKRINLENLNFANTLRLKREREIIYEQDGIFNTDNRKQDFLEFYANCAENKRKLQ